MFDLSKYFEAMGVVGRDNIRLDANETAFLNRQVESVRAKVFEVKYANLLARGFIPTAADVPAWAQRIVEVIYDQNGRAKIVGNGVDDAPRVDAIASESTFKVVSLAAAYGFSMMDLRLSAGTGVPLSDRKALMARRVIDAAIDELLCTGKLASASGAAQDVGLEGIATAAGVPALTSSNAGSSWTAATADEMYNDMIKLAQSPGQTTLQIFEANQILLAPREYDLANSKRVGTLTAMTVIGAFAQNYPQVQVNKWHRLTDSVTAGTNRCIAYARDPEVLEAVVPQEFEQLPPQLRNFETIINCHARCGGVRVHQPKAMAFLDLDSTP